MPPSPKPQNILIRRFRPTDTAEIAQLFHDTIHHINARDYTPAQLQAWAPDDLYFQDWQQRCLSRLTWVALLNQGDCPAIVVGFAELERSGHIGCFYTHWQYQGQGVGRQLYETLEAQAREWGLDSLKVEVSLTAKTFFQRLGFTVEEKQVVQRRGQELSNLRMIKLLQAPFSQSTSPPL